MSWIRKIKEIFTRRRMKQVERKGIKHDFVDIERAKKIGMIVNINDCSTEDLKSFRTYITQLKKSKKEIYLIELNFQKNSSAHFTSSLNSIFINPTKLNWLDLPIPSIEEQIKKNQLDILMNFDSSDRITSKYICNLAPAKTRTGAHIEGDEACYELMVAISPNGKRIPSMIKQFDYFLKMLEK